MSWQRPSGPVGRVIRSHAGALPWVAVAIAGVAAAVAGTADAQPASAPAAYALTGASAPDFTLRAAAGSNVRLSEHRGEVVVVSFWSSRCYVCRAQLAALGRSLDTYRSAGLIVYGVGVDDDPVQARDFARSVAAGFPMLLDPAKTVSEHYQVDNLPMTVLIDRNGVVRFVQRDYSQASDTLYLRRLRALLNE